MLKEMKQKISMAIYLLKFTVKSQFEYPLWLVSFIISIPIRCISGIMFLYVLAQNFQSVSGWTFYHLLFLYSLSYVSEGLTFAFAAQSWRIELYLERGDFDRMLVRPLGVLFQFFFKYLNLIGIVDVIVAIAVLIYSTIKLKVVFSFVSIISILIVIIGATLIRSAFLTIVGSLAFWFKRSAPLVNLGSEMLSKTTVYPISIYPQAIQFLLTFILPFGFISFYPAASMLGYNSYFSIPFSAAMVTMAIGVGLFFICSRVFKVGMGRYESTGS